MTNEDKINEIVSTFEAIANLSKEASEQTDIFIRIVQNINEFGIQKTDEAFLKSIACNRAFFEFTQNNMKFFIEEVKNYLHAQNAPEILTKLIPDSLNGIFDWRENPDLELTPLDLFENADAKVRITYLRQLIKHKICIVKAINLAQCLFIPQLTEYYKSLDEK